MVQKTKNQASNNYYVYLQWQGKPSLSKYKMKGSALSYWPVLSTYIYSAKASQRPKHTYYVINSEYEV